MIMNRSHAITAGLAAAAALAATGITYASAASAPEAVPAAVQQAPAQVPMGGDTGNNNNSKGNEGNNNNNHHENHGHKRHEDRGWIHINERSFSAHTRGCAVIVSGLGSTSLNIRNDSRKTVEVFRGLTCDNGAPIATVGPHSTSFGVFPKHVKGVHVKDGVVGSFRVIDRHDDDYDDDYDGGYGGDRGGDHGGDHGGGGDHGDDNDNDND
ncbi:hypothetical protein [Streptomyces sp. MK7]|uniref:hypothetical protein n=1 Tax=Streptomyces sp. MK7 TaxID=3067635 RepID=UPI00292E6D92|nr:hypothetical protein [Streptomyces sp. MK7]